MGEPIDIEGIGGNGRSRASAPCARGPVSAVTTGELLKEQRIALPWPSATLFGEPSISLSNGDLHLAMQFDGRKRRARLIFSKQRAFRKRASVHCATWHVEGAFDTVCEVKNSDWTAELSAATSGAWRNRWVMRHFMVYLDNFGCLEVVSESVEIALLDESEPARRGAGL